MKDKKKKKFIEDVFSKIDYKYYYYDDAYGQNLLEKALENERNYILNCSDFEKDLSPEASNRRILRDIERMKKKQRRNKNKVRI